jgi:hypothetical protein
MYKIFLIHPTKRYHVMVEFDLWEVRIRQGKIHPVILRIAENWSLHEEAIVRKISISWVIQAFSLAADETTLCKTDSWALRRYHHMVEDCPAASILSDCDENRSIHADILPVPETLIISSAAASPAAAPWSSCTEGREFFKATPEDGDTMNAQRTQAQDLHQVANRV